MASALPCVTTEIGSGNSWIVQDGVTGFVVPPEDPGELATALKKLIADPSLRRQMGNAGRIRAETHFNQVQMTARINEIYEQVLAQK